MSASTTILKLLDTIQSKALRIIGVDDQQARMYLNIPFITTQIHYQAVPYDNADVF